MSKYVPVEGHPHLVRDMESHAVINTNSAEIHAAKERKRLRKEKKRQEERDRCRLDNLERDLSEIKEALNLLIQKTHK